MKTKISNLNHQQLKILILFLAMVFVDGCNKRSVNDETFMACQSFNEFSMWEIYSDSIVEPFLLVQRTDDTIRIIQTNHINDTMIYLNKGNYWYSSQRVKYDSGIWGTFLNRFRPKVFGRDIRQQDILRFILQDKIIEVFLCDINENKSLEDYGFLPDYITVHTRHSSKTYTFFNNLEEVLDSTIFDVSIISQIYKYHDHRDTIPIDEVIYDYDCQKNLLYIKEENGVGLDTIHLNSLGLYHIPTYNFDIEEGNFVEGIFGDKMNIKTSCTTIETDKFANKQSSPR